MRFLRGLRLTRRTLKTLVAIESHLATQNQLLRRLADHLAPELPAAEPAPLGVDYLNATEAAAVDAYIAKVRADLGRDPSEDEILRYLTHGVADEVPA